jgi:hypothetical protein
VRAKRGQVAGAATPEPEAARSEAAAASEPEAAHAKAAAAT